MIRALIRWLSDRAHTASAKGRLRDEPEQPDERRMGRAWMRLVQAHADYQAAKKLWPRDREAEAAAFRRFRDARSEQIRAELGISGSSRDHARSLRRAGA